MKQYYLLTLGCQMNKNDSERITTVLDSLGMRVVEQPERADLIMVNTCSVRASAEDRVCGLINNWQKLRAKNKELIIAVTGCMPGRDKDGKLKKKIKGVDLFFGIEDLGFLPRWLGGLNFGHSGNDNLAFADYLSIAPSAQNKYSAFITIQTGCNNYCSYCVVPYARGHEKNRPVKDILNEARRLTANGAVEVTLLGQMVNHYQAPDNNFFQSRNPYKQKDDFAALLWEINQIDGLSRVHFTAPNPRYFTAAQVDALTLSKQVNYLHLPVQSGDNDILKKMNRQYTREQYLDLIKKIKDVRHGIALGTDIIVGFCGENEEQFENILDLYKQCDFDISYPAMYSPRTGTAAYTALKDDVPYEVKKERWQKVQALMEEITYKKNQNYIGRTVSVLVEQCGADGVVCTGRSSEMKLVQFRGSSELVGKVVEVNIEKADTWLLFGR